jgi:hypothetical protein
MRDYKNNSYYITLFIHAASLNVLFIYLSFRAT